MRIYIKNKYGQPLIKEVTQALITTDEKLAIPELGVKFSIGSNTSLIFDKLLKEGYADLRDTKIEKM